MQPYVTPFLASSAIMFTNCRLPIGSTVTRSDKSIGEKRWPLENVAQKTLALGKLLGGVHFRVRELPIGGVLILALEVDTGKGSNMA